MSNIVRSDPFDVAFRDFFRNMLRPTRLELETEPEIRLDLKEADNAYTVHAESPGVKKEDIAVSIDGNLVSIRAEVRRQKEEKGEAMLRSERFFGVASRSFTLASEVDEKGATAKYADGVLELDGDRRADRHQSCGAVAGGDHHPPLHQLAPSRMLKLSPQPQ